MVIAPPILIELRANPGWPPQRGRIVLQTSIYIVRRGVIHRNGVELSHSRRIGLEPVVAVVVGNIYTAIVTVDDMIITPGVNPQRMMVGMYIAFVNVFEILSAIGRHLCGNAQDEHFVGVGM